MEEIEKAYNLAVKSNELQINNLEIWVDTEIYTYIEIKEYKGLKIYTSGLIPKGMVVIGKLFI